MNEFRFIAVIDIGKTNAKVALVDLRTATEIEIFKQLNVVLRDGPYPHYDVDGIWRFIVQCLQKLKNFDAISITTHGATAALIDADGNLALPILDYEHDVFFETYKLLRPKFSETGSPLLPVGLNLGAQLYWLESNFPEAFAKTKFIMMYPQYWAWRLTGMAASEVTSLGCHTDLWCPQRNDYSTLVDRRNWRRLMAPLHKAASILGQVRPELGLARSVPVAVGIHDSNASLMSHLKSQTMPFAVVSTGTWVVAMAVGSVVPQVDETRDCLINVNAYGEQVPSARFMGGREFEMLSDGLHLEITEDDINTTLRDGIFLLPAVVTGSGPFPDRKAQWIGAHNDAQKQVALAFYLAMMTETCLTLIDAQGEIIVEGPFARNQLYCRMLAEATGRAVVASESSNSGTTIGAAFLLSQNASENPEVHRYIPSEDSSWQAYASEWKHLASMTHI